MLRKNYRNVLYYCWDSCVGSHLLTIVAVYGSQSIELTKKDFNFPIYGRAHCEFRGLGEVYNLNTQIAQQEKITGIPHRFKQFPPFMHPPFILPLLALIAYFAYVPAYHLWAVIQIILSVLSAWVLLDAIPRLRSQK